LARLERRRDGLLAVITFILIRVYRQLV
jgi:hypothetical protein